MTTAPAPEAIEFRAEIRQLLDILVHSLYQLAKSSCAS